MLNNGDVFPSLVFARAGGGEIRVPDDVAGGFGVILFNRGSWCRFCNTQLAAFARAADRFAAEGIKVVSISVDGQEKAEALVAEYKLASLSAMAPMDRRFPRPPAPSSMTSPLTFRQPASSSIPTAES